LPPFHIEAWNNCLNLLGQVLVGFVLTGITNARTEGINRLAKRSACGFRNRDNSARRIRFHCTRTQRAATQTSC